MINVGPEQDIISIVPNRSNNNKRGNRKLLVRQEATTEQDTEPDTNKDDITQHNVVSKYQVKLSINYFTIFSFFKKNYILQSYCLDVIVLDNPYF